MIVYSLTRRIVQGGGLGWRFGVIVYTEVQRLSIRIILAGGTPYYTSLAKVGNILTCAPRILSSEYYSIGLVKCTSRGPPTSTVLILNRCTSVGYLTYYS